MKINLHFHCQLEVYLFPASVVGQDTKSSSDNSMLRNYMQVLFVTAVVGRMSWDNTSSPLKFKIFCHIFMTYIFIGKYVLASQDGAEICTPKYRGDSL